MKKFMSMLLGICIFVMNTAVPMAATEVTSLIFSNDILYMQSGTEASIPEYSYSPKRADPSSLVWESDNESLVYVTDDGTLYAEGVGASNISVYNGLGTWLASFQVNVDEMAQEELYAITAVNLYESEVNLNVGEEYAVEFSQTPRRADFSSIFWISDDATVATSKDGVVTAKNSGSTVIRVIDINNNELASFTVNVNDKEEPPVEVEGGIVFMDENGEEVKELTVDSGITYILTYTAPDGMDTTSLYWSTSDAGVADVKDGVLFTNGAGTAYITVMTADGMTVGELTVYVKGDAEGGEEEIEESVIFYDEYGKETNEITIEVGENWLNYSYSPEDANIYNWNWYSTNSKAVSVSMIEGLYVYASEAGSADIVVENEKGVEIGRLTVYVNGDAEGGEEIEERVTFYDKYGKETNEITIDAGEYWLNYSYSPEDADIYSWNWYSTDSKTVSVSMGEGLYVYASEAGSADIVVENEKGVEIGRLTVYVNNPTVEMTGLSLNKDTLDLKIYDSETLTATVTPSDAVYDSLEWSSDNTKVVTVNQNGYVYAKGAGTATVTVSANNGFTASCFVRVTPVYVESITLNTDYIELYEGGYSEELYTTSVLPSNATNREIEWTSDNEDVATMNSWGEVVSGVEGETVIRATAKDGSGVYAECRVVVRSRKVKGVELDKTELELLINETYTLNATVTPSYASNKGVTWSSDNTSVATVSSSGKITAKAEGEAVIKVTTKDGGYTATCRVTVKRIPVTGVSFENSEIEIELNQNVRIPQAIVEPSNATNQYITYTSDNYDVLSVYSYGYMYGQKEGTANLIATTEDGSFTASCKVTVKRVPVTGISFETEEMELDIYDYVYLSPVVEPSNATNQAVTYSSDNSSVVSVTSSGRIYANSIGTANITATTVDGGYTATLKVTVPEVPVTGIICHSPSLEIDLYQSTYMSIGVEPSNATNRNVTYSSDNPYVASVDAYSGRIYGESVGEAVITATTEDGGYTTTCNVKVNRKKVTGIKMYTTEAILCVDDYDTISCETVPWDATNNNILWTSADESVATVTQSSGSVRAVGVGETLITATTVDGGYSATCKVNVIASLDEAYENIDIAKGQTYNLNYEYDSNVAVNVQWESSNTSVATVENGVVTAVGKGETTIKFIVEYNGTRKTLYCYVNVNEKSGDFGNGVTWELGGDNGTTLYIRGSGEIPDIYWYNEREYSVYKNVITDIVVENGVTAIGSYAFQGFDKLERVYIADTVSDVDTDAFYNCSSFEYVVDENSLYIKEDGVLFTKDMTKLISYPVDKTGTEYTVPDTVKVIAKNAFAGNTYLKKIVLGENTEIIEESAFANCTEVDTVIADKKLTSIGAYAFSGCKILKIYYYGSESEWHSISKGYESFYYSRLVFNYVPTISENGYEYYVKDGAAYIAEYTGPLSGTFTIADTLGGYPVKTIGEMAFASGDEFDVLIVPEGIEVIENYAFSEILAKKIVLPSTLSKIGKYALGSLLEEIQVSENNQYYSTLEGVLFNKDKTVLVIYPGKKSGATYTVPDSVKFLANDAFSSSRFLENVVLGENVVSIGYYTFELSCIKSITIPAGITNIEYNAFYWVDNLTDVYYGGTVERWNTIAIQDGNDALYNATIHYGTEPVPPVYIKMGATDYDNNCYYYNVYLNDVEDGATVAIAYYNKGKLVYCDYQTYNKESNLSTTVPYLSFERNYDLGTIDTVKAMVWDSVDGMIPMYEFGTQEYLAE